MPEESYLMENNDEISRLELKTDSQSVIRQATWAGLKPGMKVADIGCGSGKTTSILRKMVEPGVPLPSALTDPINGSNMLVNDTPIRNSNLPAETFFNLLTMWESLTSPGLGFSSNIIEKMLSI